MSNTAVEPADEFESGKAILLEVPNPNDPTFDDIEEFLNELQAAIRETGVDVYHAPDEVHGAGTTLWHVIYLWLPDLHSEKDLLWGAATSAAMNYLNDWRKRRNEEASRPGEVKILYGPDGEPLSRVVIDPNASEARVATDDLGDRRALQFLRRRKRS